MHLHELEMHFLPKSELDCIDASKKSYTLAVPKHFYLGWGWGQALVNIMLLFGLLEPEIKPEKRLLKKIMKK